MGTALGFTGTAGVILGGLKAQAVPEHHEFGLIIMTIARILGLLRSSASLLEHYSPLKVTTWIHFIGAFFLIPLGARDALAVNWLALTPLTWLCFLHFTLVAGVYGFVVWFQGVATIGASGTVLFQYCVPIVATLAAYFLLHEAPTIVQIAGMALTLVGLHLAVPRSRSAIEQAVADMSGE